MSRHAVRALALAAPALALLACSADQTDPGTPEPPPPPPPGQAALLLRVTPLGTGPQGYYSVTVDSMPARYVTPGATTTVMVPVGRRVIRLANLPSWCTAVEQERAVEVAAGNRVIVAFTVTCTGATIRVTTDGTAKDDDGYAISVDGDTARVLSLPLDGEALIGIPAGPRVVALTRVAANCRVPSNPRTVDIGAEGANRLVFAVTCEGAVLRVETSTTGSERDVDGYTAAAGYGDATIVSGSGRIGIADARLVGDGWRPGTEVTVSLGDLADNCVSDAPSRSVAIPSLDTVTVRFTVTCSALPAPGILLSATNDRPGGDAVYRYVEQLGRSFKVGTGRDAEWAPGATAMVRSGAEGLTLTDWSSDDSRVLTKGLNPRFSPDGMRLLYLKEYGCPWGCNYPDVVSLIDLAGPFQQPGTAAQIRQVAAFDLSPDGASIAAIVQNNDYTLDLVVVPVDGSAPWTLQANVGTVYYPGTIRFSPDGRELLVQRANGGFVVPVDGSPARKVSGADTRALAWSPDGGRVLVGRVSGGSTEIATVRSADGSALTALTTVPGSVYAASWRR